MSSSINRRNIWCKIDKYIIVKSITLDKRFSITFITIVVLFV